MHPVPIPSSLLQLHHQLQPLKTPKLPVQEQLIQHLRVLPILRGLRLLPRLKEMPAIVVPAMVAVELVEALTVEVTVTPEIRAAEAAVTTEIPAAEAAVVIILQAVEPPMTR